MLYIKKKGSVGYTVVGTPTIVDGVASGFSTDNYLDTTLSFDITQPFQIHFDIAGFSSTGVSQYIFGLPDISAGVYFGTNATSVAFSHSSFYWTAVSGITVGTPFTLDVIGDGTNLTITTVQSGTTKTDSKSLSDCGFSSSSSSKVRIGKLYQAFTSGTINLNNTYIKVNGQPWFGVCPVEVKKHQIMGPVGYTVVGSPTITDGVISGFASGSYVQTDTNFSFAQPLEICFTATTSSDVNTSQLFCSVGDGNANRSFGVTIESGAKMGVAYTTNGASWVGWLPSSYVFEANTRYNFFIDYVPSSYFTINVKKATETSWTTFTNSLSAPIYTSVNCPFIFGQNYQNKPFFGSIDLNETYIKVNGKLWFWQPRETERILVNGVEVWNKNEV